MNSFLQTLDNFFNAGTGFLFGSKSLVIFRALHVLMTFIGCVVSAQVLWDAADFCNGVMCIPNLFSLIIFSRIIALDTRKYIDGRAAL